MDQLDPIGVNDPEHGRGGQEGLRPVVMGCEETKEPRPLGQAGKPHSTGFSGKQIISPCEGNASPGFPWVSRRVPLTDRHGHKKITSTTSMPYNFTTKSGGVWQMCLLLRCRKPFVHQNTPRYCARDCNVRQPGAQRKTMATRLDNAQPRTGLCAIAS